MKHFLTLKDISHADLEMLLARAKHIKKAPAEFKASFFEKTLLTIFQAPSLRTRLSFAAAATQMGGHAVFYHTEESTLGKKESMKEFARSASCYSDMIAARLYLHSDLEDMARYASVPVINAMTNYEHPCQIMGDLLTIEEKLGRLKGLKLAYLGDGFNNVTHSLLYGCSLSGIDISVACPKGKNYEPLPSVIRTAEKFAKKNGSKIEIMHDARAAAKNADVVYTDSWMSYRIPHSLEKKRTRIFSPFQVNEKIMALAKPGSLFMHCLPAKRGAEVTDRVIDSRHSVVIDQAANRLHVQKALMLWLMKE
jgi:ornithine carbamoyltransferase